jgi:DNA-binding CsgD family transcriptional regulator
LENVISVRASRIESLQFDVVLPGQRQVISDGRFAAATEEREATLQEVLPMRDARLRPAERPTTERTVDLASTIGINAARVPDLLSPLEWSQLLAALRLSPRQAEVLRHALYDSRDSRIAERMRLPISTVHSHRGRLFRKLAVGSMAEALSLVFATYVLMTKERFLSPGGGGVEPNRNEIESPLPVLSEKSTPKSMN